jgi:hypothetical protein
MKLRTFCEQLWSELREPSKQRRHAGENMDPESQFPMPDTQILLLNLEEGRVATDWPILKSDL